MRPRIFSSFAFLNITQFLGALNDNVFRLAVVFLGISLYGAENTTQVVLGAGLFFVLPFLLFSLPSGTLADRISKRKILVTMKIAELVVMALGIAAFYYKSLWGGYGVLFLMTTQSAIFGPSKYGIVPELVPREKIAVANGVLTGFTVGATILGVFFASLITDMSQHNLVFVGIFCTLVAVLGLCACLAIEKTPPAGSTNPVNIHLIAQIIRVLKRAKGENYLLSSILGSAYFYLFGSFTQLNSLPYTIQALGLTDVQSGYLFAIASLGIAGGALFAGKISGKYVELGLSPIAGLILGALFCITQFGEGRLVIALLILIFSGAFGGIFLIPFDAYTQSASLDHERGENISASNFLAFVGVSAAVGLLYLLSNVLKFDAVASFRVMGILTIAISLSLSCRLTDTFVRLAARILYAGKKRKSVEGHELVSSRIPTLFLCSAPTPQAGLLFMIIFQQRYMRLVIERPKKHSSLFWILCRLAKVALYKTPLTTESKAARKAKKWLERGYSVTLIPQNPEALSLEELARELTKERSIDLRHVRLTSKGLGIWAPPLRAQVSR